MVPYAIYNINDSIINKTKEELINRLNYLPLNKSVKDTEDIIIDIIRENFFKKIIYEAYSAELRNYIGKILKNILNFELFQAETLDGNVIYGSMICSVQSNKNKIRYFMFNSSLDIDVFKDPENNIHVTPIIDELGDNVEIDPLTIVRLKRIEYLS